MTREPFIGIFPALPEITDTDVFCSESLVNLHDCAPMDVQDMVPVALFVPSQGFFGSPAVSVTDGVFGTRGVITLLPAQEDPPPAYGVGRGSIQPLDVVYASVSVWYISS